MNIESTHEIAVYAGYISDTQKLKQSASGGIATALSEEIIKKGGYVVGVTYSDDFHKAQYIITNKISDLEKLKGSKYIEVDRSSIYKEVKNLLDNDNLVLFIGLPCTIAALNKFLPKEYSNLITCELVCHGPTSQKVHLEYVNYLEKKYNSTLSNFTVRYKKYGWTPSYLRAEFKNGKVFEKEFSNTEYGYAFKIYGKPSCYNCQFKGNNRTGDMMIGDFWGATNRDAFWNKDGVSSIFVHTEKANNLLRSLDNIKLFETTFEQAVKSNPMVVKSKVLTANRDKFEKMFNEKGLIYAVHNTQTTSFKIKKAIKSIIPKKTIPYFKKIYKLVKK